MAENETVKCNYGSTTQEQNNCAAKHHESAKKNLQYLQTHPKRFSSDIRNELVEANNSLYDHYKLVFNNLVLAVRELEEMKENLEKAQKEIIELKKVKSYASVAKQPTNKKKVSSADANANVKINKPRPECVLRIIPKNSKSADETEDLLRKIDLSDTFRLWIDGIRKGSNNSVTVCCGMESDTDELSNIITDQIGDKVSVERLKLRNPTVSVLLPLKHFGNEVNDEKLLKQLERSNGFYRDQVLKVVHKRKTKKDDHLVVLEMGPRNFAALKEQHMKIYVGWGSVTAREQKPVSQCYNCCKFWHKASACKFEINGNKAQRCSRCGGNHDEKTCTVKICCPNCADYNNKSSRRMKYDTKHSAKDPKCPVYREALAKGKSLINYHRKVSYPEEYSNRKVISVSVPETVRKEVSEGDKERPLETIPYSAEREVLHLSSQNRDLEEWPELTPMNNKRSF